MLRVISFNANGIRAAARKKFFTWFSEQNADILCLQEIKANIDQLTEDVFFPQNYHHYFYSADRKGYSGVAIYAKHKPKHVHYGLGFELADTEGRYLQIDYEDLSIASLYLPSGTSGELRQTMKYQFLDKFYKCLQHKLQAHKQYIICGDWNIAHKAIDLKNWRANQKSSGFLPAERAWLDKIFENLGLVDAFRVLNQEPDQYTWWSHFGNAWQNNTGWRIDYQIVSPNVKSHIKRVAIYREQKFSDHAPLIIDYSKLL